MEYWGEPSLGTLDFIPFVSKKFTGQSFWI